MSTSFHSYAVLGCPLPDSFPKARVMVRKRAFDHDYPDDGEKEFDPKTGARLWLDETEEVDADYEKFAVLDEYDSVDPEEYPGMVGVKLGDYGLSTACTTDEDETIVGIVVGSPGYEPGLAKLNADPKSVEETRQKVKAFMEAIDSWDPESFGFYSVGYVSY